MILRHNFSAQINSMMHAVFTYGASTVHMATIDVDEFLDSPNATLVPALPKRGHVLLQWSPLSPFDGVKGTPILSSRWSAMQLAGRQDRVVSRSRMLNTKTIVHTTTFAFQLYRDIIMNTSKVLYHAIHTMGFGRVKDHEAEELFSHHELKVYHAWCRFSDCFNERANKSYFTAGHARTLLNRIHAAEAALNRTEMAPLLRWHHRVQTQLRGGDPRPMDHVMLYGIGRSGTSIAQFVLSPKRLAVFEPCSIFDRRHHFDVFDDEESIARCRALVRDLANCHITEDEFGRLKRFPLHTKLYRRHWESYRSWMEACWQTSLIIKEIRVDPVGEWRSLSRFRFIHMQRKLADVISSRSSETVADAEFDGKRIAKSWMRLQETANAAGDHTVSYERLVSHPGDLAQELSAVVGLSPADLGQTLANVKADMAGKHGFLVQQLRRCSSCPAAADALLVLPGSTGDGQNGGTGPERDGSPHPRLDFRSALTSVKLLELEQRLKSLGAHSNVSTGKGKEILEGEGEREREREGGGQDRARRDSRSGAVGGEGEGEGEGEREAVDPPVGDRATIENSGCAHPVAPVVSQRAARPRVAPHRG